MGNLMIIEEKVKDRKQNVKATNQSSKWTMNLKHTSKVIMKWLKDNKVKVLEWPSESSNLHLIENMSAELKNMCEQRGQQT